MLEVKNVQVFGLERSLHAAANPMTVGEIDTMHGETDVKDLARAKKLGSADRGSGHDNYLSGILVQMDILYPQYWSMEFQRYHFAQIVSSQSKMHRLCVAAGTAGFNSMFNEYVDIDAVDKIRRYVEQHNAEEDAERRYYFFMKAMSNLPMGYEMWMTVSTNYLQLKTIYAQRKTHKLREDWQPFCKMIEELPMFKELTTN